MKKFPHEHIFIDISAFFEERPLRDIADPVHETVKMEHLGQLALDPYALKDNLKMEDYDIQNNFDTIIMESIFDIQENVGFGIDFGFSYEFNKHFGIAAGVYDLGFAMNVRFSNSVAVMTSFVLD